MFGDGLFFPDDAATPIYSCGNHYPSGVRTRIPLGARKGSASKRCHLRQGSSRPKLDKLANRPPGSHGPLRCSHIEPDGGQKP